MPVQGEEVPLANAEMEEAFPVGADGAPVYDGYDGRQSWRVRNGVVVETEEGPGAGGVGMPQTMSEALFTDLAATLQRVRADYKIQVSNQGSLSPSGPALRHVVARRNSREVRGPETIEIWADLTTAMPHRIVFN